MQLILHYESLIRWLSDHLAILDLHGVRLLHGSGISGSYSKLAAGILRIIKLYLY